MYNLAAWDTIITRDDKSCLTSCLLYHMHRNKQIYMHTPMMGHLLHRTHVNLSSAAELNGKFLNATDGRRVYVRTADVCMMRWWGPPPRQAKYNRCRPTGILDIMCYGKEVCTVRCLLQWTLQNVAIVTTYKLSYKQTQLDIITFSNVNHCF